MVKMYKSYQKQRKCAIIYAILENAILCILHWRIPIQKNTGDIFYGYEMIAMLLAGGQGSRLYALTQKLAKPAVPFGGKYRIIDFPLSNCVNSGIDTVGILTQYQPMVLNEYIGNGQPWDLDRLYGGVHVLPPYQKSVRLRLV